MIDMHGNEFEIGRDGGIQNFIDDIEEIASHCDFVLELGVATGTGSTVAIDNGGPYLHISVDQEDRMVWKPSHSGWHLIIGDDREEETLDKVLKLCGNGRPQLIYVDTDHDYAQMSVELPLWARLATNTTVWLFHDTHMFGTRNESMIRAITEFAGANGWVFEDWRTEPHGLGRMVKR